MRAHAIRKIGLILLLSGLAACASEDEVRLSVLHHFDRGNQAYAAEDYSGAIRHYRAALEMDGRQADIWYNLGLAYYRIADYEHAVETLEQARSLDPKRPEIHYNLALAYHESYDLQSAHREYHVYQLLAAGTADGAKAAPGGDVSGGRAAPGGAASGAIAAPGGAANAGGASARAPAPPQAPGGQVGRQARAPAGGTASPGAGAPPKAPERARLTAPGDRNAAGQNARDNPFEGKPEWWKEELPRQ